EAAVYPLLRARLLDESLHPHVTVQLRDSELQIGPHQGQRRQLAMSGVKVGQSAEVDVGDPVRVSGEEGPGSDRLRRKLQPAPGGRVLPGVDASHLDPLGPGL